MFKKKIFTLREIPLFLPVKAALYIPPACTTPRLETGG